MSVAGTLDRCRARGANASVIASFAFPAAVTVTFAVLVAANLNGSSVGVLTPPGVDDPALIAGAPRPIRSDEWALATPIAVSAVRQDFPTTPYIGLTATDQDVVPYPGPRPSWTLAFTPQQWGYLLLGAERGLAVHWWLPFAVALLGTFVLFRVLGGQTWSASGFAIVVTMTPYAAWWSAPAPSLVLGYGALAGAALIAALRASSRHGRLGWALSTGVAASAMFFVLYPPWVISVSLVIVALVGGFAADLRVGWRRLATVAAGASSVLLPVLGIWFVANQPAIEAISDTTYPGQRISRAGGATLSWLLDAPLNPLLAGPAGATVTGPPDGTEFTNLSEVSATWLPLPVVAVATALVLRRCSRRRLRQVGEGASNPGIWTVIGVTSALLVLLAWALLPLPAWTGTLLLERVPPRRLPLAIGLACMLVLAVSAAALRAVTPTRGERLLWLAGATATLASTVWSARHLPWDAAQAPVGTVLALGAVAAVGFALVGSGYAPRVAIAALAAFACWSWALVNPLYRGLGPLDGHPVVQATRAITATAPGARVQVFGDGRLVALVRSAGTQSVSGLMFYPDVEFLERLLPGRRAVWNTYAIIGWVPAAPGSPARIEPAGGLSLLLHVDPCDPVLRSLDTEWVVSEKRLAASCLDPIDVVPDSEPTAYFYRMKHPSAASTF